MTNPKMFDPLALATRTEESVEGRVRYTIPTDVLYPAVLDAIEAGCLPTPHSGDPADERYDEEGEADVKHWRLQLLLIGPKALAEARKPIDDAKDADARRQVLETARGWFTNELHRAAWRVNGDAGIILRITCPPDKVEPCGNCDGTGQVGKAQPSTCQACRGRKEIATKQPSPWRL